MYFAGKNIVITGGTGGIGIELAGKLLENGASCVGLWDIRDNNNGAKTLTNNFPNQSVEFYKVDIKHKEQIRNAFEKFIEKFKFVDIVINSAGIVDELNPDNCVQINLTGVINTTFEAIERMSKSKNGRGGTIVNVSSICGILHFAHVPVYNATKHGILAFTKSMMNEINSNLHAIKFITICPGITETPLAVTSALYIRPEFLEMAAQAKDKHLMQTARQLVHHMVAVIEENQNGAIVVIEDDRRGEFTPNSYKI